MISKVRELSDAELEVVAGGLDLGAVADAVAAAASGVVSGGGVTLGMRKSGGGSGSGLIYLAF